MGRRVQLQGGQFCTGARDHPGAAFHGLLRIHLPLTPRASQGQDHHQGRGPPTPHHLFLSCAAHQALKAPVAVIPPCALLSSIDMAPLMGMHTLMNRSSPMVGCGQLRCLSLPCKGHCMVHMSSELRSICCGCVAGGGLLCIWGPAVGDVHQQHCLGQHEPRAGRASSAHQPKARLAVPRARPLQVRSTGSAAVSYLH